MLAISLVRKIYENPNQNPIHIIELGPGRGTLMADMMRAFASFPRVFKSISKCSFVEISPVLKRLQQDAVRMYSDQVEFSWVDQVKEISTSGNEVTLIIAQEFFDAIPIRVFKKTRLSWVELMVAVNREGSLCLIEEPSESVARLRLDRNFTQYKTDDTVEISPGSWSIAHEIGNIVKSSYASHGIIIDYGHFRPSNFSLRVERLP